MDKNIRITLQYDGTRYDGWQKQGNTKKTIQGKLEAVLEKMTGYPVEVHGSGRTDAGVHAFSQTANFHLPQAYVQTYIKEAGHPAGLDEIRNYMNRYLPEDIAVTAIREAPPRFHSRLSAVSKTYIYRIETAAKRDVFDRKFICGLGRPLDVGTMRRAASLLAGTHDFKGYSSLKKYKKSTVRTLERIEVETEGTRVFLTFTGDGFLYNMVRILAGTLIEIGLGERTPESVTEPLLTGNRETAGRTAPAEGLFLKEVRYPEKIFQNVQ